MTDKHYLCAEILAYLQEAEHWTRTQLYDARRSCLHSKQAGEITGDECLAEATLINLALEVKDMARDQ